MRATNQRSVKGSGSVRTWWCFRLMTARGYIKYSLAVRLPRDCFNCSPLHDTSHSCASLVHDTVRVALVIIKANNVYLLSHIL